jgi:hypothetical protein
MPIRHDGILFTEWRNNNERVRYPFIDSATLVDSDGNTIDEDLFTDARIYAVGAVEGVYLNRIEIEGLVTTFAVADESSGELAAGTFDPSLPRDDVALYDAYGRPAGILVSTAAKLSAVASSLGNGTFTFERSMTEFVASAVVPMPEIGVRGLILDDDNVVAGDIVLVGDDGIVLSLEDGYIRIDAIGDPYALAKACEDEGLPLPTFCGLRTINGIGPDDNGDFKFGPGGNISEDTILRVEIEEGVLRMKQVCIEQLGLSGA